MCPVLSVVHLLSTHTETYNGGCVKTQLNLLGILEAEGPQFEEQCAVVELSKDRKKWAAHGGDFLASLPTFLSNKTDRSCLAVALLNPAHFEGTVEHRLILVWLQGSLFQVDSFRLSKLTPPLELPCAMRVRLTEDVHKALQILTSADQWNTASQQAYDLLCGRGEPVAARCIVPALFIVCKALSFVLPPSQTIRANKQEAQSQLDGTT